MSVESVKRSIQRFSREVELHDRLSRKVFLLTDSKGRCLSHHLERQDFISIIHKGGAKIGEQEFITRLGQNIDGENRPVIFVWLGTCDMTRMIGRRFIELNDFNPETFKHRLEAMKCAILQANQSSEIYFLQCPYYSIYYWNKSKGRDDSSDKENDKVLEERIDRFNLIQFELSYNTSRGPKFSLDLLKNTKTKQGKRNKYFNNFKDLYTDGIHPSADISKLWLLRIKQFALNIISE
jgi:hypothetical protein